MPASKCGIFRQSPVPCNWWKERAHYIPWEDVDIPYKCSAAARAKPFYFPLQVKTWLGDILAPFRGSFPARPECYGYRRAPPQLLPPPEVAGSHLQRGGSWAASLQRSFGMITHSSEITSRRTCATANSARRRLGQHPARGYPPAARGRTSTSIGIAVGAMVIVLRRRLRSVATHASPPRPSSCQRIVK